MKVCVQKPRKDGFWPVYIRVTYRRKVGYWKTPKLTVTRYVDGGSITDPEINQYGNAIIESWQLRLNAVNCESWKVAEIIEYCSKIDEPVSFSKYVRSYYARMEKEGRDRTAKNYKLAIQHLERHIGSNDLMFGDLTEVRLKDWISQMVKSGAKRCKEMYPVNLRMAWKAALLEYNDPELGIIRIKNNPWERISIPKADDTMKQAKQPEDLRQFFNMPIPETRYTRPLMEIGRDVAKIAFCLGGMYCVDLWELNEEDYHHGIIHYYRAKTRGERSDRAYMEMRVPDLLLPLFEKYKARKEYGEGEKKPLFVWREWYGTEDSFCANVNMGIRQVCQKLMGLSKEEDYSILTLRHSWASIAWNELGNDWKAVAFAMNHSSAHRVTEIYVKKDFSPAWELNEKVVEFIFFSDDPGVEKRRERALEKELETDRISKYNVLRGTAYYKGKVVAEEEKDGFTNKGQLVALLVKRLPKTIPDRAIVQFVIENKDKGGKWMYEHQKGKGFK